MKARRNLQKFLAFLAFLATLAFLCLTLVSVAVPLLDFEWLSIVKENELYTNLHNGIDNLCSLLKSELISNNLWLFGAVVFGIPTLLMFIAFCTLASKKRKAREHNSAAMLVILAALIAFGTVGLFADKLVPAYADITLYACIGAGAVYLLFSVFAMAAKSKKKAVEDQPVAEEVAVEEAAPEQQPVVEEAAQEEVAQEEVAASEEVAEEKEQAVAEDAAEEAEEAKVEENEEADLTEEEKESTVVSLTEEIETVEQIKDRTYVNPIEVHDKIMKKIVMLRKLYVAGAITKNQYTTLVNEYLSK